MEAAPFITTYVVRPPTDLAATGVATTLWIPCKNARQILLNWKATNANLGTATTAEGTNLDPLVTGGSGHGITPSGILTPGGPLPHQFDLSVRGGIKHLLLPQFGLIFQVNALRVLFTGHATLTITGLECTAQVLYESVSMMELARQALTAI